ncbi:MAG: hypothetical protein KC421_10815 [Anaerolineales bacterium]|nr:hypothetical protein [Anaerolineales bacterium]
MPKIIVYHNPNFLDYRGNHSQIVPPTQPVATVTVPEGLSLTKMLAFAYAQTQHAHSSWFNNPPVMAHLRSTSAGDLIADSDGNLYVVESFGFQPYQPKAIRPVHKLAEAYRLLETACTELLNAVELVEVAVNDGNLHSLLTAVHQALAAIRHSLVAEGYPDSESPVLWDKAQPGDLVGNADVGLFRVVARRLRPKWRAKRLLAHIPTGQIWIDSPRTWAVLVPISETEPPSERV